jgi:holo-[acyl-carrier protein] synthase
MLTVGIDMIEIERVAQAMARFGGRFANRIFTPTEQAQCHGRVPSLAGRFALKEAVAKALGTGIGDVRWLDIEIINDGRGRPHLHLHHAAHDLAIAQGLTTWAVSLSHTTTHAIGMVVAQDS